MSWLCELSGYVTGSDPVQIGGPDINEYTYPYYGVYDWYTARISPTEEWCDNCEHADEPASYECEVCTGLYYEGFRRKLKTLADIYDHVFFVLNSYGYENTHIMVAVPKHPEEILEDESVFEALKWMNTYDTRNMNWIEEWLDDLLWRKDVPPDDWEYAESHYEPWESGEIEWEIEDFKKRLVFDKDGYVRDLDLGEYNLLLYGEALVRDDLIVIPEGEGFLCYAVEFGELLYLGRYLVADLLKEVEKGKYSDFLNRQIEKHSLARRDVEKLADIRYGEALEKMERFLEVIGRDDLAEDMYLNALISSV